MKPRVAVIAACFSAALAGGCGSNTTTTIETVVTKEVPSTSAQAEQTESAEAAESGTTAAPAASQTPGRETVPNELDLRLDVAEEDLESRGFTYKVAAHGVSPVGKANWTVCEMSPAPGVMVKKGTTIRLVIARFTKPRCRTLGRVR
jgi:hypothetical protein